MLSRLEIPQHLHRNDPAMATLGYEHTGQRLINLAMHRLGIASLADLDILDVGCGVRFTQAIINLSIPIKSYTGLEVHEPIVAFLNENVALQDARFRFLHWNVRNAMYNNEGTELSASQELPTAESFDLIWLFSVFTHLHPSDAQAMLQILRRHIRPKGKLFFSAFIDDNLTGFEDRVKEAPLFNAYYGRACMQSLIEQNGWSVEGFFDKDESSHIQHHFVCAPG